MYAFVNGRCACQLISSKCGPIPFARVASHQILQEDSGVSGTVVHALTLDVDFGAATVSQYVSSHQEPAVELPRRPFS
jgi:hypothetical protein